MSKRDYESIDCHTARKNLMRSDADYLQYDPFDGDRDVDVRARTVKLVTTRKAQRCYGSDGKMHDIPAGTRTRHERAIVDGTWGSFYVCLACMDKWLKEFSR
jgi:hypothetical protein